MSNRWTWCRGRGHESVTNRGRRRGDKERPWCGIACGSRRCRRPKEPEPEERHGDPRRLRRRYGGWRRRWTWRRDDRNIAGCIDELSNADVAISDAEARNGFGPEEPISSDFAGGEVVSLRFEESDRGGAEAGANAARGVAGVFVGDDGDVQRDSACFSLGDRRRNRGAINGCDTGFEVDAVGQQAGDDCGFRGIRSRWNRRGAHGSGCHRSWRDGSGCHRSWRDGSWRDGSGCHRSWRDGSGCHRCRNGRW